MSQALTTTRPQQVSKYNEADIRQEMTILRSAFPKLKADDNSMRALVIAAKWSGLNPFRGEIYYVPNIGITVAAKIRANDAISYQAKIGNTLNISFDRVTAELCAIPNSDFAQYIGIVEKGDVAFLCRIISSKQRKDYFDLRLQLINELKALGYMGRDLEDEVNRRAGKPPETHALGIVKGAEEFGESGKKFVAFGRDDRAMKRALTKALAIGGYAAPDMRAYGGVALDGEKAIDAEYTISTPDPEPVRAGVTINGVSDIIDHDEAPRAPSNQHSPPSDDSWKVTLADLCTQANGLMRRVSANLATDISAAISAGREVLRKNGSSSEDERTNTISALNAVIKAAEETLPA